MINRLINRYMNSVAVFSPPDDLSAADKQRAEIEMNEHDKEDDDASDDDNEETDDEQDEENEEADGDNTDDETDSEDDDEDKEKAETDEEKVARIAKEKEDRKEARIQKRIDKAVAEAKTAKAEAESLRKQLAEKPVEGLTEEEVERRAKLKADELRNADQKLAADKQFEKDCEALAKQGGKADPKFDAKIKLMADEVAPIPGHMIGILADLDNENGGRVLAYLADNVDEYEDIYTLPEGRLTAKLIRISDKLKAAEKAPKQRSNVPPPVTPVNESGSKGGKSLFDKNISQEEFNRIRAKQEADKRAGRGY